MDEVDVSFAVSRLGECRIPNPLKGVRYVSDKEQVLYHGTLKEVEDLIRAGKTPPHFEMGGPREKIFFDPSKLTCGIVTCGGLCPGLNDVIRAIVLSLHHHYGVRRVLGFRYGYEGLVKKYGHVPLELAPEVVGDFDEQGGTKLGSSRGPQDVSEMVDTLEELEVGLLFTLGGDGTLRGAQAIAEEVGRRGARRTGIIGIPKTIDNDISYIQTSFGFATAVSEASEVIYAAHAEAEGARNGIGLVKLMGRQSGFIAAFATLANSDVNFCLVPEVRFTLDGFLRALEKRLEHRRHAVVVVAEGAGQDLLEAGGRDASGNIKFGDIGLFLRDRINDHMKKVGVEAPLKYIDPSYTIRSMPADAYDSAFCLMLGHNAVHAGMAGRTSMVVGHWRGEFTHVPIAAAVSRRKQIDPHGKLWTGVISATGQPRDLA
jgi:6-phosphofructokinase 1